MKVFFLVLLVGNKAKGPISKRVIKSITCAYQGVRNVFCSENLTSFFFLVIPVLRFVSLFELHYRKDEVFLEGFVHIY